MRNFKLISVIGLLYCISMSLATPYISNMFDSNGLSLYEEEIIGQAVLNTSIQFNINANSNTNFTKITQDVKSKVEGAFNFQYSWSVIVYYAQNGAQNIISFQKQIGLIVTNLPSNFTFYVFSNFEVKKNPLAPNQNQLTLPEKFLKQQNLLLGSSIIYVSTVRVGTGFSFAMQQYAINYAVLGFNNNAVSWSNNVIVNGNSAAQYLSLQLNNKFGGYFSVSIIFWKNLNIQTPTVLAQYGDSNLTGYNDAIFVLQLQCQTTQLYYYVTINQIKTV